LRSVIMMWNDPGLSSTVSPGFISNPRRERPHLHDAIVHGHLMNHEPARDGRGAAYEPVRLGAGILDLHVASRDLRSFGELRVTTGCRSQGRPPCNRGRSRHCLTRRIPRPAGILNHTATKAPRTTARTAKPIVAHRPMNFINLPFDGAVPVALRRAQILPCRVCPRQVASIIGGSPGTGGLLCHSSSRVDRSISGVTL
jgi:hypothetical protein